MIFIDWLCLFVPCFDEVNSDGNKQNTSIAIQSSLNVHPLCVRVHVDFWWKCSHCKSFFFLSAQKEKIEMAPTAKHKQNREREN